MECGGKAEPSIADFGMRNAECGITGRCMVFSVSIGVYRWFILRYFTTDNSDGTDENQPILNSECGFRNAEPSNSDCGIRIAEWR